MEKTTLKRLRPEFVVETPTRKKGQGEYSACFELRHERFVEEGVEEELQCFPAIEVVLSGYSNDKGFTYTSETYQAYGAVAFAKNEGETDTCFDDIDVFVYFFGQHEDDIRAGIAQMYDKIEEMELEKTVSA